jgi:hypothetical protein
MSKKHKKISVALYWQLCSEDAGWCSACDDFTGSGIEPDAEGYTCPGCGEDTLCGVEQAMILGLIDVDSPEPAAGDLRWPCPVCREYGFMASCLHQPL